MKIEKNVKIPPTKNGPRSEIGKIVIQMEVGDSIEVPDIKTVNNIRSLLYARGDKALQRKIKDPSDLSVRYRVWRIE